MFAFCEKKTHLFSKVCYSSCYDIASPGTTLHLRVRHCISGYDIASPGTTLHLQVRHCISGYDIASFNTTLHLRVRHCISGYDSDTSELKIDDADVKDDVKMASKWHQNGVACPYMGTATIFTASSTLSSLLPNTENDIAQYWTRHNKDTVLLFCPQYPSTIIIFKKLRSVFMCALYETTH